MFGGIIMYKLGVSREFVAQHFLAEEEATEESRWHSHHYRVEVELAGDLLNESGYLMDLVELEALLEEQLAYFRDRTLNELPEFAGMNPSLEQFARIFWDRLRNGIQSPKLKYLQVKMWETGSAWAAYLREL